MKRYCTFLTVLVVTLLAVGMTTTALAAELKFPDVPENHWAHQTIDEMTEKKIIDGYPNGNFGPDDELNRGQWLTLVARTWLADEIDDSITGAWHAKYVAAAQAAGLVGEHCVMDDLDGGMTRNEMAEIMVLIDENINGNPAVKADPSKIADYDSIPVEFQPAVAQAYTKGLLSGGNNGVFGGSYTMNRAQAAKAISNLMSRPKQDVEPEKPVDPVVPAPTHELPIPDKTHTPDSDKSYIELHGYVNFLTGMTSDSKKVYIPNAHIIFLSADHSMVLGEGYTDEEGAYVIRVTVNRADFPGLAETINVQPLVSFTYEGIDYINYAFEATEYLTAGSFGSWPVTLSKADLGWDMRDRVNIYLCNELDTFAI